MGIKLADCDRCNGELTQYSYNVTGNSGCVQCGRMTDPDDHELVCGEWRKIDIALMQRSVLEREVEAGRALVDILKGNRIPIPKIDRTGLEYMTARNGDDQRDIAVYVEGRKLSLSEQIIWALSECGVDFGYDVRNGVSTYWIVAEGFPHVRRPLTDIVLNTFRSEIESRFQKHLKKGGTASFAVSAAAFWAAVDAHCGKYNRYDPFISYLEDLPEWDGTRRLEELIERIFKVSPGYEVPARFASENLFIGSIVRALEPGYKYDTVLTIVGEKGTRKSSFWPSIFPENERFSWYAAGLELTDTRKDFAEILRGCVVSEISEMVGRRQADVNRVKKLLDADHDRYRPAYGKVAITIPRRNLLVASSNNDDLLPLDDAVGRRFVIVKIEGRGMSPAEAAGYMNEYRDQLWAEALIRVRGGERRYLGGDEEREILAINERYHRMTDETLENAIEALEDRRLTLQELAQKTGYVKRIGFGGEYEQLKSGGSRYLGGILKQKGWVQKQDRGLRAGAVVRYWQAPD